MGLFIIIIIVLFIIWLWKKELFSPPSTFNNKTEGPPPPKVVDSFNCKSQRTQTVSTFKSSQPGMHLSDFPKCPVCHASNKEGRREVQMMSQGEFKCVNGHVFTGKER